MTDKAKELKINGVISTLGIIMIITGIYLFALLCPELIAGLTVLLITILIDVFWTRMTENNDFGILNLFGAVLLVVGLLAINIFSGSWVVFIAKFFLFALILFGAFFCSVVIKRTN